MTNLDKVFDGLDERETAYVLARSDAVSNSEALRKCGYSQGWLSKRDIEDLNIRADRLRKDKAIRASMILAGAIEDAAKVKVAGLKVRSSMRISTRTMCKRKKSRCWWSRTGNPRRSREPRSRPMFRLRTDFIGGRECLWTWRRMLEMTRVIWER